MTSEKDAIVFFEWYPSRETRISRAEAIRLAKANRARIESLLAAEVERDAAIKAVWEDELASAAV